MISLASEFTDAKGPHARGWLFYDAECNFCTRIARWVTRPMRRRRLGVAPLQDRRVATLLGVPQQELLRAIRYLAEDGTQYAGADALVAVAREFWWASPLALAAGFPTAKSLMHSGYEWVARRRKCNAQAQCGHEPVKAV